MCQSFLVLSFTFHARPSLHGVPQKEKGERDRKKARRRETAGKEMEAGGMSNLSRDGVSPFVVTVDTVGNGVTRKLNAFNGKDDARWNLVQWYRHRHILWSLTLDLLCRNVFKR